MDVRKIFETSLETEGTDRGRKRIYLKKESIFISSFIFYLPSEEVKMKALRCQRAAVAKFVLRPVKAQKWALKKTLIVWNPKKALRVMEKVLIKGEFCSF